MEIPNPLIYPADIVHTRGKCRMSLLSTIRFIANHPLNRAHKLGSIIRYAKWQIGSRLVPGAVVYEWVNGSKFIVKSGEKGLTGNIYCGVSHKRGTW
jgi:hypothetical protein